MRRRRMRQERKKWRGRGKMGTQTELKRRRIDSKRRKKNKIGTAEFSHVVFYVRTHSRVTSRPSSKQFTSLPVYMLLLWKTESMRKARIVLPHWSNAQCRLFLFSYSSSSSFFCFLFFFYLSLRFTSVPTSSLRFYFIRMAQASPSWLFFIIIFLKGKREREGEKVTHAFYKDERKRDVVKKLFLLLIHFYSLWCRKERRCQTGLKIRDTIASKRPQRGVSQRQRGKSWATWWQRSSAHCL